MKWLRDGRRYWGQRVKHKTPAGLGEEKERKDIKHPGGRRSHTLKCLIVTGSSG